MASISFGPFDETTLRKDNLRQAIEARRKAQERADRLFCALIFAILTTVAISVSLLALHFGAVGV